MLSVNACTYLVSCARGIKTFSFEQMTISYRMKYMGLGFAFGLLFGFVSSRTRSVKYGAEQRNYEFDFLKFIFTICVFMSHTGVFRKENTNIILPPQFGQVSVFFFFVVSGMLMANSILKKEINTADYGKLAVMFVISKIKTLALDVYAALFVFMAVYIFTIPLNKIPGELVKMVPELFFVTRAGISITYNVPGWYLSAMFLAMLPLAYLLYRNRDFTETEILHYIFWLRYWRFSYWDGFVRQMITVFPISIRCMVFSLAVCTVLSAACVLGFAPIICTFE